MSGHEKLQGEPHPEGHEHSQVHVTGDESFTQFNIRMLWLSIAGLVAMIAAAFVITWFVYQSLGGSRDAARPVDQGAQFQEEPARTPLSPDQRAQRAAYEALEARRLSSFDWIDPERTRVRIPIEDAMQQVVEEYSNQP